jgi:flagellar biosynthesis protein FlhB
MAESDGQEKTEQPTGKKLSDSRKEGKVAKSTEVNSFAVFTSGMLMVFFMQKFLSSRISDFSINIFNKLDVLNINRDMIQSFTKDTLLFFLITLAPVLLVLFVISFVANIAQVGLKFSAKALKPDLNRFNPFTGIKKVFFSSSSMVELAKSLLKLILIGGFTYSVLSDFVIGSSMLVQLTIPEIVKYMVHASFQLLWKISLLYVVIAALDFIFQKKKFIKDMMMTKQEVKEENKQSEGDPQVKSRIRKLQFAAARNRMMQSVPKADVVITNPTHFAIALKYDSIKNAAPKVLAKGADELAQKIKEIAREHDIPIHEDRELARALYRVCDIGDEIPSSLFKAVAQVLAYIYQLKNNKKKKSIV